MNLADKTTAGLVDQVYTHLETMIVTLRLPPGALLSETLISKELGVSRTPVGEALQRLARERLVTILPRRGVVVTEISASEQLRLLEIRREISRFIARVGSERATPEERHALRTVAKDFLKAASSKNVNGVIVADKTFHDLFAKCSHNHFAESALGPLDSLSRRFSYVHQKVVREDIMLSANLHANIATAIADGAAAKAEEAVDALAEYLDEFARSTLDSPLALSK